MSLHKRIESLRRKRLQQEASEQQKQTNIVRHPVTPRANQFLLQDFNEWLRENRIPITGHHKEKGAGWCLLVRHDDSDPDQRWSLDTGIFIPRKGPLPTVTDDLAFLKELVATFVAKYDYPWPYEDDYTIR